MHCYVPQPHEFIAVIVLAFNCITAHQPVDLALAISSVNRRENLANDVIAVGEKKIERPECYVGCATIIVGQVTE